MRLIIALFICITTIGCKPNCENCKEFKSKNLSFAYSFVIDEDEWNVTKGFFNKADEFYLSSKLGTLNLNISSCKNEYQNTSCLENIITNDMFPKDLGSSTIDGLEFTKTLITLNDETEPERTATLFNHVGFDHSLTFSFVHETKDILAKKTDFEKTIESILIEKQ